MPQRINPDKLKLIAAAYCTNGYNKTKALLTVGYKHTYAANGGHRLFKKDSLLQAIAKIQAQTALETTLTVEEVQKDLANGLKLAVEKGDLQAIARFSELRGKTLAMFTDKIVQEEVIDTPTPEEAIRISDERRQNIQLNQSNTG